ncbi:MAG: NAD(+)/NADH kinase [Elusimicrobia bacterium]|nr:NAD(+)/NADH kinase [Elusimicrobiota bacterium]
MPESKRPSKAIRSIAIFFNERKPSAKRALAAMRSLLRRRGVLVAVERPGALCGRLSRFDAAVVLGGDGTMLRTARFLAGTGIPMLGVNTGGLGFLSAVDFQGFKRSLGRILAGRFLAEERRMLCAEVRRGGRRVFGPCPVLNDCVLRASGHARAVTLKAYDAGRYIATYFGDGLIVSTPTGSTAYALAVGGPVVHPGIEAVILAPICPHTLTQRPLILPSGASVSVELARKNPQERPQALVSLDGQVEHALKAGDVVVISPYGKPVKLLFDPRLSYFELLRAKLKWGER